MSTWIPNQPVIFDQETDNCSCDIESGAQLVDNTDTSQFQFEIAPCLDAESLIEDTDFNDPAEWTLGGNWSMAYNQLCKTELSATPSDLYRYAVGQDVFEDGKYYKVTVTVDSISGGELNVFIGSTLLGTITTAGTFDLYGFATAELGEYRLILRADNEASMCLSNVQAYEIYNQFKFAFYTANDNSYQAIISYENTPSYFTFAKNTLTVTVNWGELGLSDNCYYICLLDPCVNTNGQNIPITITNPNFTGGTTGWNLGVGWSYGTNDIDWVGFINPDANELTQEIFPTYSAFVNVTIVVTAISGDLDVYFGTTLMGQIQGTGTHYYSGTPFGGKNLRLVPSIIGSGTIDSITWNAPAFYEYTCDQRSNTFKVGDYSDECTLLVNACNNEDGLGFVFEDSGFSPRLRLEAKMKTPRYPSERSVYEDSLGEKRNTYFKRRKAKYFCTDLQPEYIHDFLSLLMGFDNFYIDGTAYAVEDDEYTVEESESLDNLAKVKILVSERIQNTVNINCSSNQNICNLGENVLLQSDDLTQYITLTDGQHILING